MISWLSPYTLHGTKTKKSIQQSDLVLAAAGEDVAQGNYCLQRLALLWGLKTPKMRDLRKYIVTIFLMVFKACKRNITSTFKTLDSEPSTSPGILDP